MESFSKKAGFRNGKCFEIDYVHLLMNKTIPQSGPFLDLPKTSSDVDNEISFLV